MDRNRYILCRRVVALVVPLALLAAGCGSSTSLTSADTTADPFVDPAADASAPAGVAEGDTREYCDTVVAFDAISSPGGPGEATVEDYRAFADTIRPLVQTMAASAPAEVDDAVATLASTVDALAGGDLTVTEDPALFAALERIENSVRSNCDVAAVDITAVDFAFELPDALTAGPTSLRMTNDGGAPHVLILLRAPLDDEDDVAFITRFLSAAEDAEPSEEFAAHDVPGNPLFAEPGSSGTAVKVLDPGEYVVFCPIPVDFSDPSSQAHYELGMHGRVTVEG